MLPRRSAPPPPSSSLPTAPLPSSYTSYAEASELDKYKLVSNIGKGSFGVISKVQRIEDGREFALKQLDYAKMTDKDRKQILAEVAILESLKHRNIVQLIQKIKDPKNERIYIIMEYCTSGDLGTLIRKAQRSNTPMNEDKIWNIFLQIVQALHHCHWPNERSQSGSAPARGNLANRGAAADKEARYQVLHRDLKPENVFLSDDFVKLGDFGLSKDMGTAAFTSTYVGTPLYMPPEILAENKYDTKSDIWSLGCLVFEMMALSSPFATAQTQTDLITMVRSGRIPSLPAHYSSTLKSVVKAMLTLNPTKRPTTKDLLELEEMKLHRKLFSVQNQTQLLVTKKDELRKYEETLHHRLAQINEREESLLQREAAMNEREAAVSAKEEMAADTQKRLNHAAETLRAQWEKLREEKAEVAGMAMPQEREPLAIRRPSMPPVRPVLEERATMPIPSLSRPHRPTHTLSYDDTPSKIPIPIASSPSSFFSAGRLSNAPGSLRRAASKSLGNLAARAQAEASAAAATAAQAEAARYGVSAGEATPAKQVRGHVPKRSSIGSPGDLRRQYTHYSGVAEPSSGGGSGGGGGYYAAWSEDVSMASPAMTAAGSPFQPSGRRRSAAATTGTGSSGGGMRPSDSASSTESLSGDSVPNLHALAAGAYTHPTPAKWQMDDPDLPSPFLRRIPTAPPAFPHRAPLGTINAPQPSAIATAGVAGMGKKAGTAGEGAGAGAGAGAGGGGGGAGTGIPRSKSGNLHQRVLKHNAAQAQQQDRPAVGRAQTARAGSAAVGR